MNGTVHTESTCKWATPAEQWEVLHKLVVGDSRTPWMKRNIPQWQNCLIPWRWHYLTCALKNWVPYFSLSTSHASEPVKELSTCNITHSLHIHISLCAWSPKRVLHILILNFTIQSSYWFATRSVSPPLPKVLTAHTPCKTYLLNKLIIFPRSLQHLPTYHSEYHEDGSVNHWCHSLMIHNGRTEKTINLMEGISVCS